MDNIQIFDIETLIEQFLCTFYDPKTKEFKEFSINKNENDLFKLVNYLNKNDFSYLVGFNSCSFDAQVLEYILRYHEKWVDLSNLEVAKLIADFAQECISRSNYNVFPAFREEYFTNRHIDLFKIHHFDNENRRTGLKWLEFMMDLENVEEMPVHWTQENLTDEDIQIVKNYCRNDVLATYKFYLYTIGETNNEVYKGKNKIQDRLDVMEEYSFPITCINWSDVRIGDEINMLGYTKMTGLGKNQIYDKKFGRAPTKKFTFGDCIPDYVEFVTPEFKSLYKRVQKVRVNLTMEQSFDFTYNKTSYSIMKGGIHSKESNRIISVKSNEILCDSDVGSQYPNAIVKRKLFPSHLGKPWLNHYANTIEKRIEYKHKGKENLRLKGVAEMLKLAVNGGFGKTNETTNWQYDPLVTYYCTIGNQFEILMLIEQMEINNIHVVSANTDGIVCLYTEDKESKHKEICEWWEKKVGNDKIGKLEHTYFTKLVQLSVNHYIAIKADGSTKKKGSFATIHELNKNKSRKIVALALEAYFGLNIDPEEFIKNHKNIFDFCIGVKSSKNYHYELIEPKSGDKEILNKMVRYVVTTNGKTLLKIKNEGVETKGVNISQCEAPDDYDNKKWLCTAVNKIDITKDISEYNIDYDYYLRKITNIINKIEGKKKVNKAQLSLF